MALEKILEKEHSKIGRNADIQKKTVSYFVDFINDNYQKIMDVFVPMMEDEFRTQLPRLYDDIKKVGFESVQKDFFENRIYSEVLDIMDKLNKYSVDMSKSTIYKKDVNAKWDDQANSECPDALMGLVKYFKFEENKMVGKILTDKGIGEVNRYRSVLGLKSIEDERLEILKVLGKYPSY